jgi:Holliday junction resolvase
VSDSSKRGKSFEQDVAAILRKKLGARVTRDRRSGAGTNRADISDYHQDLPFHIECKDHETIKIKDWMRQAISAASFSQVPTLVFRMDEEIIAAVRFSDLVNLALEIADLRAENTDLRSPTETIGSNRAAGKKVL